MQLIEENEKMSYILSSINENVSIINSDYKFIYNNRASSETLNKHNIIGKNIFDVIHPDYHEIVLNFQTYMIRMYINDFITVQCNFIIKI